MDIYHSYGGDQYDPKIRKFYLKKVNVVCPRCSAVHEYQIRVQGITGVRGFASRAIDCDHHCKTCGASIEPIPYVPDQEEVRIKRILSEANRLKKGLIPERTYVMTTNGECGVTDHGS